VTDLEKLNVGRVPNHEAFYSSLTKSNISTAEYQLVCDTWQQRGWSTLRDLLIYYNNLDVKPFVEAVENLLVPYLTEGFDIFKYAFSVSGAAKLKMLKAIEPGSFFCLFPKRHEDLYRELRSQLTGGLSIVFTRLAIAGETTLGMDANSLYLYAIKEKNPCGYFVRYKESEDFRPDPCSRYGLSAFQWLSWLGHSEKVNIRHAYNGGEKPITKYSLLCDGVCHENRTVYEFYGCFFHGCDRCAANRVSTANRSSK